AQHRGAIARINADDGLSPKGRADAIVALSEKTATALREEMKIPGLRQMLASAEAAIPAMQPSSETNVSGEVRAGEIRQLIRGMREPGAREGVISTAASSADEETIRAVVSDPLRKVAPMIGEDFLSKAVDGFLRSKYPTQFARLASVRAALQVYESNLK